MSVKASNNVNINSSVPTKKEGPGFWANRTTGQKVAIIAFSVMMVLMIAYEIMVASGVQPLANWDHALKKINVCDCAQADTYKVISETVFGFGGALSLGWYVCSTNKQMEKEKAEQQKSEALQEKLAQVEQGYPQERGINYKPPVL